MNYIGIDISKNSSAMVIETNNHEYCFSYNTNPEKFLWNIFCSEYCYIRHYNYDNKNKKNYSDSEINKLKNFSEISSDIMLDILKTINLNEETIIYIEGYSYGTGSSQIIDLVGIGTSIRLKIYEGISKCQIKILAPKSLKMDTCRVIYGVNLVNIGKKKPKIVEKINPNTKGIPGGNFTKIDIFEAILDGNFNTKWSNFLVENQDKIKKNKSIPKPIEDINDAFLLKELSKLTK